VRTSKGTCHGRGRSQEMSEKAERNGAMTDSNSGYAISKPKWSILNRHPEITVIPSSGRGR
jgi:hypothetical protein